MTAPATASEPGQQASEKNAWVESADMKSRARALTLEEVKARGLTKYVDVKDYKAVAPRFVSANLQAQAQRPQKWPDSNTGVTALAQTCWTHWFGHGIDELYGRTDVTWCGDGGLNWINYSASACYGDSASWAVTYKYLGCKNVEDFGHPKPGEYWNVYDVWTQWNLCTAYVPAWGSCVTHDRPQHKYRYGADGSITQLD